ncbi:hypothetical protein [Pectobacterium brasiliense]|uniref:hypothetical protein n=1 Tax=Pectobacterium brasiliense TaxID=180957 RepID=UPI0030194AD0
MVELPASLSLDKIDTFIRKVKMTNGDQPLLLPLGKKNSAFGGIAIAVQSVNTWANLSLNKKLILKDSSIEDNDYFSDLINTPHKFTAAMMSKEISFSGSPDISIRHDINKLAKEAIESQSDNLFGQQHGRLCWYSFVDHSTKGFDSNFYNTSPLQHPEPKGYEQIRNIISAMVLKSSTVAGGAISLKDDSIDDLGRIFYELFINTHEHGSRSVNRHKWINPGNRLIYTYGINLSDDAINNYLLNDEVLEEYIKSLKKTSVSSRRFIEVSIIDSGLGFCGRWLADRSDFGSTLNIDDEYQIIKKCLKFRSSSTNNDIKGNGLPSVMASLTKLNGFMKIRSNRVSIYRDFNTTPYLFEESDDCDFLDWSTRSYCDTHITEHAEVCGVSITILIPLIDKNNSKDDFK